jgi:hypothetical protein
MIVDHAAVDFLCPFLTEGRVYNAENFKERR